MMLDTQIARPVELEALYLQSLAGYDGHGMYPGLSVALAAELVILRNLAGANIRANYSD